MTRRIVGDELVTTMQVQLRIENTSRSNDDGEWLR